MDKSINWWEEYYGFFGEFYISGDDSLEGYRVNKKQTLGERTHMEVEGILRLLKLEIGADILDCPCGYGRHSIELATLGHEVTGVDLNAQHLSVAKSKGVGIQGLCFEQKNMLDISYESKFDAIVNMFYSFGFFETDQENMYVLKNFYQALKPGGKFLMHTDVNIPFIQAGKYKHDETRELSDGRVLRIVDVYNPQTKRIDGSWSIQDVYGDSITKEYSVRVYTKDEFVEMCLLVGFSEVVAYADWDGSTYDSGGEDMIIVARK